jgi:hypothetical protein
MLGGGRSIGVGIFPPHLYCVLRIDHHDIRCRARTPGVASYTCVSILVLPFLLISPIAVAVAPSKLLKCRSIRSIPEMHAHVYPRAGGAVCSAIALIWKRTVLVVGITIVVTIPASLHAYLIGIHDRVILCCQRAFYPKVGCITVYLLSEAIAIVDIEKVPLERISERICACLSGPYCRYSIQAISYRAQRCAVFGIRCNDL